jgi:hypothetical protein
MTTHTESVLGSSACATYLTVLTVRRGSIVLACSQAAEAGFEALAELIVWNGATVKVGAHLARIGHRRAEGECALGHEHVESGSGSSDCDGHADVQC